MGRVGESRVQILRNETIDLELLADLIAAHGIDAPSVPPIPRDVSKFHVTNLIDSAKQITKGVNEYHEYQGAPKGIMSLGRIWESVADIYLQWWVGGRRGGFVSDVVVEGDGIIASLDGVVFLPELGPMVQESKLRFTLNEEIPIRHQQQVKAYCHLARVTKVLFAILSLTSSPPVAHARLTMMEFDLQSIEENWEMILNTKKFLEGIGEGPR